MLTGAGTFVVGGGSLGSAGDVADEQAASALSASVQTRCLDIESHQYEDRAMERGVYVMEFGGLTELVAIDHRGQPVRRLSVRTDLYREEDRREMEAWLDRVSQPAPALQLVT
jgi:hypothetical protein